MCQSRSWSVVMLFAMLILGCVTPHPAEVPAPATVEVIPADARALRYGVSAPAVVESAELRDKIRTMFGSDWMPAAQGGGRLQYGAAAYFPANSRIRMLRMDGRDYIAINGCVVTACATHRGLVLIRADGEEMWGRLDEGGFSRYYGHGPGMTGARVSPAFIDSAWRAVERVDQSA
jgi:hypothetical protein